MVYKVIGDFSEKFSDIIELLSKNYLIIYLQDTLYIGIKKHTQLKNAKSKISGVLKLLKDNFYLEEINEKNLLKQPEAIQDWAKKIFIHIQTEQYELKEQESLRNTWNILTNMENILKEIVLNNEKQGVK